jgi:hypothetical protein
MGISVCSVDDDLNKPQGACQKRVRLKDLLSGLQAIQSKTAFAFDYFT